MSIAQAASDDTPSIASQNHLSRAATPSAAQEGGGHLQVRLYNAGVVPAADQLVAVSVAAAVLAAAGIDTNWLACGYPASPDNQMLCDTPLRASELSVRLVQLPALPTINGDLQLGYSLVDTAVGEGKLATVFADRVGWLAKQANADSPTLVGLAMAHEIGHLLLGTSAHGRSGLMRAVWTRAELRRRDAGRWQFTPSEAAQMRSSLARREGLRSSQLVSDATGCLPSVVDAAGAAATTECGGNAAFASIRGVAARSDR